MKTLALLMSLFALFVVSTAGAKEAVRLSEPVQTGDGYEVFGAPVDADGETLRLAQIIAAGDEYTDQQVRATATVSKVCQKKGCFFIAQDGDSVARITFVDYSFFVPTDSGGKDVTIVGTFKRKQLSEAQARHYAEDAGEDPAAIEGPREEYAIVATAVMIPTS